MPFTIPLVAHIRRNQMLKVLFRVKCIDASDSYDYLELGKEYGVSRVSAPNSIGLVNTRGKDKGEITPNEEEVYYIEGMPAEWDASRFEVIEEEETYDEFGVNTKNSFNTPPKESK